MRTYAVVALALMLLPWTTALPGHAQAADQPVVEDTVVDPTGPVDSLGEQVYARRPKGRADLQAVPGALVLPRILAEPEPEGSQCSAWTTREHYKGGVDMTFVVTAEGRAIDAVVQAGAVPEASVCLLSIVEKYRFRPATLDRKAVAMRLTVSVDVDLL